MNQHIVCINCPKGCRLTVEINDGKAGKVTGNQCQRGIEYARQEAVMPMRTFTGLMRTSGSDAVFSVRTNRPIPKSILLQCADELRRCHPLGPVKSGDVIRENILGTGSDILATSDAS
jgi:CxxC motif-containing protein